MKDKEERVKEKEEKKKTPTFSQNIFTEETNLDGQPAEEVEEEEEKTQTEEEDKEVEEKVYMNRFTTISYFLLLSLSLSSSLFSLSSSLLLLQ